MSTFGCNPATVGNDTFVSGNDEVDCSPFALSIAGTVTAMSVRIRNAVTGTLFRMGIYATSSGGTVIGALLGFTSQYSGNTVGSNQVVTLSMTTPLVLSAGTYGLALHCGNSNFPTWSSQQGGSVNSKWKSSQAYGSGMPNPFPASPSTVGIEVIDIWATYTASAAIQRPIIIVAT